VWKAWTDPSLIKKWFGSDPNGTVLNADLDVRPGGRFEVTFTDSDLTEHTCRGTYDEVQPFRKLSFSWSWQSEPGAESFITLSLAAKDNDTIMHFQQANPGNASKHNYVKGWNDTFSKLERLLTSPF
jgi:uncharacterized protein YndB with AHSA1/START domain